MLNADWVQLNCRCKPVGTINERKVRYHKDYRIEEKPYRTALAKRVEFVYYKNTRIAEVLSDVDSPVIDNDTIFVRFDNKFLYQKNLYESVVLFLKENDLIFHNWTRLDVCCDFNYMLNGWGKKEMVPSSFIKRYVNGDVRLHNKRRGKKRKGNLWSKDNEHLPVSETEFKKVASKNKAVLRDLIMKSDNIPAKEKEILLNEVYDKQAMGIWFEDGESGIDLQTLRLGSKYSAVTTKLYNKSKELQEQEDKPYIREQWSLNGLDLFDIESRERVNTWRLEFSITDFNSIVAVADESQQMAFSLKELEILKEENIELLWNLLREQYFVFYKEDGTKNVTRKKKLRLFDTEETGMKLHNISLKEETTRAHKIFIKKLLETQQVIREDNALNKMAWATDFVAAWLVNRHDLKDWAAHRFPGWKYDDYTEVPEVAIEVKQFSLNSEFDRVPQKHKFSF